MIKIRELPGFKFNRSVLRHEGNFRHTLFYD
jgi:hypothetical protein